MIVVPGYGMAQAHAAFEVVRLADLLEKEGKQVRFAVHPVAGRMPGHMHVLLAEAEVEYEKLFEMQDINDDFASTDVVLVVGACDVVNPAAVTTSDTPISGMPILNAHDAGAVIVCNLDEKPGYSGVPNPLYDDPKAILLFGDAKGTLEGLIAGWRTRPRRIVGLARRSRTRRPMAKAMSSCQNGTASGHPVRARFLPFGRAHLATAGSVVRGGRGAAEGEPVTRLSRHKGA